jgi:polar amino acid transport system substrate-binding protein
MKKIFYLILSVLLISAVSSSADTITIVADEWCPYNCNPESDKPGYMIEIAAAVFQKSGHAVDYKTVNWSRAIDKTRKGKYTAIVGASKGDAPDFIFSDQEQGVIRNTFFVIKGNSWKYSGIDSLAQIRLGVIQDYDYGQIINPYLKKNSNPPQVQFVKGDNALELNIKKIEAGRIDAFLEDENVFLLKAAEMGKTGLFSNAGYEINPEGDNKIYIAFSPSNMKSKEYATILSKGMEEIRRSGILRDILTRYGLSDWQKK